MLGSLRSLFCENNGDKTTRSQKSGANCSVSAGFSVSVTSNRQDSKTLINLE